VEINDLIDRLEDVVNGATKVPLTSRVMLDPEEIYALIDALRETIPDEIREAGRIAHQREEILQEAKAWAEAKMREAQAKASQLTSDSTVTKEAEGQANEVIDQAKRVAREIRQNALAWADDLFARVQPELEKLAQESTRSAAVIRKAREELQQEL
jgi:cell division septum initiation protein DivIVA